MSICSICNDTGKVRCSHCYGEGSLCTFCYGTGEEDCKDCAGRESRKGFLFRCISCGYEKLITYKDLKALQKEYTIKLPLKDNTDQFKCTRCNKKCIQIVSEHEQLYP